MTVSKGEKVKLALALGIAVETAIALFDAIEALELPRAKAAKTAAVIFIAAAPGAASSGSVN